ncbi:MAG: hypothetical protein AAGE52_07390 [Myxococcota bacterium]
MVLFVDLDETLTQGWERVEEAWDDDEAHRKFVALCASFGRLDAAGKRYSKVRDSDPKRREVAEAQIERVLKQAMATLELTKTEPNPAPKRRLMWVALAVASLLVGFALYLWLDAQT